MNLEHYRTALDDLRFSDEQKTRMTDRLMLAQETHTVRRPFTRLRRVPVLAVLLIALLLATAGGFAVKMVSDWFAPRYGNMHSEIINELGSVVGVSDTHEGITITADAIMGDRHRILIALTASRDNGELLTREMMEEEFGTLRFDPSFVIDQMQEKLLSFWGDPGSGSFRTTYEDADKNDNRFQIYYEMEFERSVLRREIALCFTNQAVRWNERPSEEHSWMLRFKADYPDCTKELRAGKTVRTEMGDAVIDVVEVSPLGIHVEGHYSEIITEQDILDRMREIEPTSEYLADDDTDMDYYIPHEFELTQKDGTVRALADGGRGAGFTDGKLNDFQCRADFGSLIPLDDIESISINGVDFAVN